MNVNATDTKDNANGRERIHYRWNTDSKSFHATVAVFKSEDKYTYKNEYIDIVIFDFKKPTLDII